MPKQLEDGTAQEICKVIFDGKSLDEVKRHAENLLDHCLSHGWVDEELRESIVENICREYGLTPPPSDDGDDGDDDE